MDLVELITALSESVKRSSGLISEQFTSQPPVFPSSTSCSVSDTMKFEIYIPIFLHAYQKGHKPSSFIFYCAYQTVFNGCIQYAKWLSLFLLSFIQIRTISPPLQGRAWQYIYIHIEDVFEYLHITSFDRF